jgi:hypothetical protein
MSINELDSLLQKSREYNLKNNITGILLYMDGDFIQVLEGEKETLITLYDKILKDSRHKGIITVFNDFIKEKQFPDWTMGFSSIRYEELKKIKGLETINKDYLTKNKDKTALIFLQTFIKTHLNRIACF